MLACATDACANDVPSVVTVFLPGGGIGDIQINNYENPGQDAGTKTLLAVHGLAHSGATFEY